MTERAPAQLRQGGLRLRGVQRQTRIAQPLISIVTVAFNASATIEQTMASVFSQSYDNIEYIVIDGASTDGTLAILEKYADRCDYWQSEPDDGIFAAMNKGVALTTGEYIAMLNADDWYEPGTVAAIAARIVQDAPAARPAVVYCDYALVDAEIAADQKWLRRSDLRYWRGMTVKHQAMFVSREAYMRHGNYNTRFTLAADYDFFLRLVRAGETTAHVAVHGVNFRMGGASSQRVLASNRQAWTVLTEHCGRLSKPACLFVLTMAVPFAMLMLRLGLQRWLGSRVTGAMRRWYRRIKVKRSDMEKWH